MEPRFGDRGTRSAKGWQTMTSENELQWSRGSVTAERTHGAIESQNFSCRFNGAAVR